MWRVVERGIWGVGIFAYFAKQGELWERVEGELVLQGNPYVVERQWRIQDFPEEGVPTPRGAPTYDFAIFSQKLHEIERIWAPRGARIQNFTM